MELQVTLTLSDRLFALLEDKLPNLGRRIEKAVTKEIGAQTRRESGIEVKVNAKPAETAAPAPAAEEVPEAVQQPESPAQAPVPGAEKNMGEMIRSIMHRTRQRFEGEDYKENAGSEAYKKYHRMLNGVFKQIALVLGYEKPSYIDTPEKVEAFAAECDALIIDEKGFITSPPAPY